MKRAATEMSINAATQRTKWTTRTSMAATMMEQEKISGSMSTLGASTKSGVCIDAGWAELLQMYTRGNQNQYGDGRGGVPDNSNDGGSCNGNHNNGTAGCYYTFDSDGSMHTSQIRMSSS
jgi:hypothetical protein